MSAVDDLAGGNCRVFVVGALLLHRLLLLGSLMMMIVWLDVVVCRNFDELAAC